ncbi:MAG: hypothetical protein FWH52_01330 [Synergistaceae bacterium]|nr:hypothetical protein [Synergistaceae bacterium]
MRKVFSVSAYLLQIARSSALLFVIFYDNISYENVGNKANKSGATAPASAKLLERSSATQNILAIPAYLRRHVALRWREDKAGVPRV